MELSLSGNALKTFGRSVTCLARVGNDLSIQASPSQLAFHSLNSSRTAFQSITFKPGFFDVYTISGNQVECKVLLKAVCSVLRTPVVSVDHLSIKLPEPDAPKLQWTLECFNGMRKSYWITCNVEPNTQHMSLDRTRFLSNFVVRPRDLNKLLANNFVASLQEITIIATEPNSLPSDVASEIGGKAVELRSYKDPTKDNDSSLHTQLWIDPLEEFVQYTHTGDPVDVTFGVKELKAFLSFCEGCEVDIQLYFDKAGEPILMAPKFGLDVGFNSNFDASLVLATMLQSQLHELHPSEAAPAATPMDVRDENGRGSHARVNKSGTNVSENPSDHTKIWSDLSASGNKNENGAEGRQGRDERNVNSCERRVTTRISSLHISDNAPEKESEPVIHNTNHMEKDHNEPPQDRSEVNGQDPSQHHRSNWVDANEDEEEDGDGDGDGDDDGEDHELYVQSTPLYHEDQ